MKALVHRAKAYLLLCLIYHRERTSIHSENIAFFGLTDYQECQLFMKELAVNRAELIALVEQLFESGLVRFIQLQDTLFVFLTEKACHFVQKQKFPDQPCLFRVEEDVENGKKE